MLNRRQDRFYTDTVDIWARPGDGVPITKDANKRALNLSYKPVSTPDQTAVRCMLQTAIEGNRFERPIGRTAFDNIFTLDRCFFEVTVDINDQDVVRIKTAGHPLLNEDFIVQGAGVIRESRGKRKGNYRLIQLKRTNEPPNN